MLIAQITDVHLGFEPDRPDEPNRLRLDRTIAAILALTPAPDLLLVTGDLTENGDTDSYVRLREALAPVPLPVLLAVGNHDLRGSFRSVFPETPTEGGFVHYVADDWPVRIVVLDTLEEGRHGGAFCEARAAWLEARLSESAKPTLIVLHHPPVDTGIAWMTSDSREEWVLRVTAVVSRHRHVIGAVSGHIHRAIVSRWAGATLAVCPSTAPQVALDLNAIDLEHPDQRPLIVAEAPGFALHRCDESGIQTFFGAADDAPVLARYDAKLQPLLQGFAAEH